MVTVKTFKWAYIILTIVMIMGLMVWLNSSHFLKFEAAVIGGCMFIDVNHFKQKDFIQLVIGTLGINLTYVGLMVWPSIPPVVHSVGLGLCYIALASIMLRKLV